TKTSLSPTEADPPRRPSRFHQLPRHLRVEVCEAPRHRRHDLFRQLRGLSQEAHKLTTVQDLDRHRRCSHNGRSARTLIEQRDLTYVIARPARRNHPASLPYLDLPVAHNEELGTGVALGREHLARRPVD